MAFQQQIGVKKFPSGRNFTAMKEKYFHYPECFFLSEVEKNVFL